MKRLISPALVAPDAFDLLPADFEPSQKSRRNLVLLTILLRKCGFGKSWASANYMSCFNPMVEKIHESLLSVADTITQLPIHNEIKHFREVKKTQPKIYNFEFESLLDLHLLFYQ